MFNLTSQDPEGYLRAAIIYRLIEIDNIPIQHIYIEFQHKTTLMSQECSYTQATSVYIYINAYICIPAQHGTALGRLSAAHVWVWAVT